jgi:hypothetical protein
VLGPRAFLLDDEAAAAGKTARDPAQLPERLLPAARGLAKRVMAGQVLGLPSAHRSRWLVLAPAVVLAAASAGLIVTGHRDWLVGILISVPGWLNSLYIAVCVPRRARRNAQWLLRAGGRADLPGACAGS